MSLKTSLMPTLLVPLIKNFRIIKLKEDKKANV